MSNSLKSSPNRTPNYKLRRAAVAVGLLATGVLGAKAASVISEQENPKAVCGVRTNPGDSINKILRQRLDNDVHFESVKTDTVKLNDGSEDLTVGQIVFLPEEACTPNDTPAHVLYPGSGGQPDVDNNPENNNVHTDSQ